MDCIAFLNIKTKANEYFFFEVIRHMKVRHTHQINGILKPLNRVQLIDTKSAYL